MGKGSKERLVPLNKKALELYEEYKNVRNRRTEHRVQYCSISLFHRQKE